LAKVLSEQESQGSRAGKRMVSERVICAEEDLLHKV
jgi:hypothetical protein